MFSLNFIFFNNNNYACICMCNIYIYIYIYIYVYIYIIYIDIYILWVVGMRVYLQILMATLIFNDIWYPEQVSKRIDFNHFWWFAAPKTLKISNRTQKNKTNFLFLVNTFHFKHSYNA